MNMTSITCSFPVLLFVNVCAGFVPCSTDPSPSPPVRDVGPLYSPYSEMEESGVNTNGVC